MLLDPRKSRDFDRDILQNNTYWGFCCWSHFFTQSFEHFNSIFYECKHICLYVCTPQIETHAQHHLFSKFKRQRDIHLPSQTIHVIPNKPSQTIQSNSNTKPNNTCNSIQNKPNDTKPNNTCNSIRQRGHPCTYTPTHMLRSVLVGGRSAVREFLIWNLGVISHTRET